MKYAIKQRIWVWLFLVGEIFCQSELRYAIDGRGVVAKLG
ncbi:MAG: hypothetical protein CM1200mP3_09840 [Chloroflexota bacterium]|nr:MAG: hypothetical protein CM1200mP3_09840 [Chloroflexota bacterium]